MQQRFCANLMNKTDTDRPDQRRFFSRYISQALTACAGFPEIFCELEVGARQHPKRYHFRKTQFLHVRASLHSICFVDVNRSFPPRPEPSSSYLTKPGIHLPGNRNVPPWKTGAALTDVSSF